MFLYVLYLEQARDEPGLAAGCDTRGGAIVTCLQLLCIPCLHLVYTPLFVAISIGGITHVRGNKKNKMKNENILNTFHKST
jgi:hypothetical protein